MVASSQEKQLTPVEIADKVFILESSGGKNDKCVRKGLGYNGYGWGQSLTKDNCYPNRNQVRAKVINWFAERQDEMTVAEMLCGYNLGFKGQHKDCNYYQDFKSL